MFGSGLSVDEWPAKIGAIVTAIQDATFLTPRSGPTSSTTMLRVSLDASCRPGTGVRLSSALQNLRLGALCR
jgi:hypothetical protein